MKTKRLFIIFETLVLIGLVYKGFSYRVQNFKNCQHFIYLAESFLQGQIAINQQFPCFYDVIIKDGKIFLPFGSMPAILLMPLVAIFGRSINEVIISVLATAVNAFLVWRITSYLGIKGVLQKIWLIVLFIFGSLYFIYFHWEGPWPVGHAVAVMFTMLAIERSFNKNNEFLTGLFLGMAFLARMPTIFSFPFFLIFWFSKKEPLNVYFKKISWFFLGLLGPVLFYFWYNYVRFGDIFESGYSLSIMGAPILDEAKKIGLFSLRHIPKNLYVMLFKGLDAVPNIDNPVLLPPFVSSPAWGMSIFLSTPALLFIFIANIKKKITIACWVAIFLVSLPIITYYGIGYAQFGYRYSLDFFPFLFILAVMGMKDNFTFWPRILIILGVLINTYWK